MKATRRFKEKNADSRRSKHLLKLTLQNIFDKRNEQADNRVILFSFFSLYDLLDANVCEETFVNKDNGEGVFFVTYFVL